MTNGPFRRIIRPTMTIGSFTQRTLALSSLNWQMGHVPQRPWARQPSGNRDYDLAAVGEWLPAAMPGNVQSDLLAQGRLPDTFAVDGLAGSGWVEGVDWWYRARLPLQLDPGQRAFVEFDGIDYLSAVFVDGVELGRHEGMFGRQVYEAPAAVIGRPEVELAVRVWGSDALPRYRPSTWERAWGRLAGMAQNTFLPFDDRLATLKAPMHFGWDFAPRLRTIGIWDEARLVVCRGVYVAGVQVQAEPLALPADPGPALVRVRLDLDSDAGRDVAVQLAVGLRGQPGRESQRFGFSLALPPGHSRHDLRFDLTAARLWQPWERGEPRLYEMAIEVEDCQSSEGLTVLGGVRFGVRRIERQCNDRGQPWRFMVNGEPLFLRGANWAPVDALWGRAGRERYEPLLRLAREAGVNFLRVWGGGGREKRAFYDLCDELGLLVWQEFPIACVFLDHLPRAGSYRQLLREEAAGMVRALRNHPSLFLWCGGNEFSPSRNRGAVAVMREVVAQEDGVRPFVPASPGAGDAHNWLVWHGEAPLAAYCDEQAAFASEFGLQAAPDAASLQQFLSKDELWPPGAGWERHKADLAKLRRYAAHFYEQQGEAATLEGFVLATQRAQAAGFQVMVEHMRRRKSGAGATGGLAVWQWNEPWPAISWSVVDYFGRPKLAYATLQRCMQPLLVSLAYPLRPYRPGERLDGTLWLVNDGLDTLLDCRLLVLLDDRPVHEQGCVAAANAATPVGSLSLALPPGFATLRLELGQGNRVLAENVYDLRFYDASPQPASQTLRRRLVDVILR